MKRISRSQDHETMVKALTSGENPVFKEIWRLMIFAAVLGFSRRKRIPLGTVEAGKAMPQEILGNSPVWPGLLHMLALVETDDGKVLSGGDQAEETRVTIFEEYANGGLQIIADEAEAQGYSLDSILGLLAAQKADGSNDPFDTVKI